MMRKLIFTLFVTVVLCGCRVNNGDIGDFFGSWLLESMTVDGVEAEDFDSESTFWEFQNNIIKITRVTPQLNSDGRWGTWVDNGSQLFLDFTHYEDGVAPGTGSYQAPEWLDMPQNEIIALTFDKRASRRMILWRTDALGRRIAYSLRKIW